MTEAGIIKALTKKKFALSVNGTQAFLFGYPAGEGRVEVAADHNLKPRSVFLASEQTLDEQAAGELWKLFENVLTGSMFSEQELWNAKVKTEDPEAVLELCGAYRTCPEKEYAVVRISSEYADGSVAAGPFRSRKAAELARKRETAEYLVREGTVKDIPEAVKQYGVAEKMKDIGVFVPDDAEFTEDGTCVYFQNEDSAVVGYDNSETVFAVKEVTRFTERLLTYAESTTPSDS